MANKIGLTKDTRVPIITTLQVKVAKGPVGNGYTLSANLVNKTYTR